MLGSGGALASVAVVEWEEWFLARWGGRLHAGRGGGWVGDIVWREGGGRGRGERERERERERGEGERGEGGERGEERRRRRMRRMRRRRRRRRKGGRRRRRRRSRQDFMEATGEEGLSLLKAAPHCF